VKGKDKADVKAKKRAAKKPKTQTEGDGEGVPLLCTSYSAHL
jgi:hypothetical protein